MKTDTAYLRFHVTYSPLGVMESLSVEWDGKSPYTYVSYPFISGNGITSINGDREIQAGPYLLLKVKDEPSMDCALYVRKDKLGMLRVALYKSTRLLDLFYRRLIVTLAVWRLADFQDRNIPSWKDIHLLKRFVK